MLHREGPVRVEALHNATDELKFPSTQKSLILDFFQHGLRVLEHAQRTKLAIVLLLQADFKLFRSVFPQPNKLHSNPFRSGYASQVCACAVGVRRPSQILMSATINNQMKGVRCETRS